MEKESRMPAELWRIPAGIRQKLKEKGEINYLC